MYRHSFEGPHSIAACKQKYINFWDSTKYQHTVSFSSDKYTQCDSIPLVVAITTTHGLLCNMRRTAASLPQSSSICGWVMSGGGGSVWGVRGVRVTLLSSCNRKVDSLHNTKATTGSFMLNPADGEFGRERDHSSKSGLAKLYRRSALSFLVRRTRWNGLVGCQLTWSSGQSWWMVKKSRAIGTELRERSICIHLV